MLKLFQWVGLGTLLMFVVGCGPERGPTERARSGPSDQAPGVRSAAPDAARIETLTLQSVPGGSVTIELPPDAVVRRSDDSLTVTIRPGTRTPLEVVLGPELDTVPDSTGDLNTTRTLANGATVRFSTREIQAVGSGGEEAELRGTFQLGSITLVIVCRHQGELPGPEPEQCLDHLATAQFVPPP